MLIIYEKSYNKIAEKYYYFNWIDEQYDLLV